MAAANLDTLEIEISPNALEHLKKNHDVYVLTDVQNPQYTYYRIKGYEAKLRVTFEEFVEICKAISDDANVLHAELDVRVFNVASPSKALPSNLGFYVAHSGYPSIDEWLKTLKEDEIPECAEGHRKMFYLYHIETVS